MISKDSKRATEYVIRCGHLLFVCFSCYIMYDLLVFGRPLPKISTHDLNKALSCAGHMFIEFFQERIGSSCHSVWARLTVECVAGRKKRKEGGGRDWEGKLRRCTSGAWALSLGSSPPVTSGLVATAVEKKVDFKRWKDEVFLWLLQSQVSPVILDAYQNLSLKLITSLVDLLGLPGTK